MGLLEKHNCYLMIFSHENLFKKKTTERTIFIITKSINQRFCCEFMLNNSVILICILESGIHLRELSSMNEITLSCQEFKVKGVSGYYDSVKITFKHVFANLFLLKICLICLN